MEAILGLSAYCHDSAAALLIDGEIVAAAQEERFTRKKHDPSFPLNAARYALEEGDLDLADLSAVVFYDKPYLRFERLLETYHAFAPKGVRSFLSAMPVLIGEKLSSPFEKAAILTLDGVGEWGTTAIGYGDGNRISILKEQHFPHSLGLL